MKIIQIFLMLFLTHLANISCMETTQSSQWYALAKETITHIVAISDLNTKETLRSVNKQLLLIASKSNVENLLYHFPCIMKRQDHLDCLVKYAKKNNQDMVHRLINTAKYCNHSDWFSVIRYFLSEDDSYILLTLNKFNAHSNTRIIDIFFPHIMAVYAGKADALEQYKNNYGSNSDYLCYENKTPSEHIRHISPINLAIITQHPPGVIQLLISQDKDLLNIKDACWDCTPLMVAVHYDNINICKLLLSYKNIDLTKSMLGVLPLFNYAQGRCFHSIAELLKNYENEYTTNTIPLSEVQQLLSDLRTRKRKFEKQLHLDTNTKEQFIRTQNLPRYFMKKIKISPIKFLHYCYYQELHEKISIKLKEIYDSGNEIHISGYSAFGAVIMRSQTPTEKKRIFIEKLIQCGFTPTREDINLEMLIMYDEIITHQEILLLLLHTHPPTDWLGLPQVITRQIAHTMIQLLKYEIRLLPEKYYSDL